MFSKDHRVLSQCNTRLRLLYLLNNCKLMAIAAHFCCDIVSEAKLENKNEWKTLSLSQENFHLSDKRLFKAESDYFCL